jgi:hypothetical protein
LLPAEVAARAKALTLAAEHHDARRRVGLYGVERLVDLLEHGGVERVVHVGSREREARDAERVYVQADGFEVLAGHESSLA